MQTATNSNSKQNWQYTITSHYYNPLTPSENKEKKLSCTLMGIITRPPKELTFKLQDAASYLKPLLWCRSKLERSELIATGRELCQKQQQQYVHEHVYWKIGTQPFGMTLPGSWGCTTIPNLVAYCSLVRKISSGQRCDTRTNKRDGWTDRQPDSNCNSVSCYWPLGISIS